MNKTSYPQCPSKETKVYLTELVNIVFELDKRRNEGKLTEFEATLITNIFKSWFTAKEVKSEDAKAEREQE